MSKKGKKTEILSIKVPADKAAKVKGGVTVTKLPVTSPGMPTTRKLVQTD